MKKWVCGQKKWVCGHFREKKWAEKMGEKVRKTGKKGQKTVILGYF